MISIIDCGIGNVGSLRNMLKRLNQDVHITSDFEELKRSKGLILPGVGSFDAGVQALNDYGLADILHELVMVQQKPILGICLGMHLMTKGSQEGQKAGLNWFDAEVTKFNDINEGGLHDIRVPHMGWNEVTSIKDNLLLRAGDKSRFYFVHSYLVECNNADDAIFKTQYGDEFTTGINRNNIYGVQFHPEKSHKHGFNLMKNFCDICHYA